MTSYANNKQDLIQKYLSFFVKSIKRANFVEYDQHIADIINGTGGYSQFSYEDGKYFYDYINSRDIYLDPDELIKKKEPELKITKNS